MGAWWTAPNVAGQRHINANWLVPMAIWGVIGAAATYVADVDYSTRGLQGSDHGWILWATIALGLIGFSVHVHMLHMVTGFSYDVVEVFLICPETRFF
jgi:hypothetical protein